MFASAGVEVSNAQLVVTGAVLVREGLLNDAGLVAIRYQSGVLSTIGLSRTGRVIVQPMNWQEVR